MDVRVGYKECWVLKNWCFWTVVLEKTLESPLDCKEIQSGIHCKYWCWSWSSNTLATICKELTHQKRPWCWERLKAGGKDWRQEEKGTTEDEMVGRHHRLDGHESGQTGRPDVLQSMGSQSWTRLSKQTASCAYIGEWPDLTDLWNYHL